jgi:diguanylate cyclase (GGDEF)-like protein/PAS domain S-box-containing protein
MAPKVADAFPPAIDKSMFEDRYFKKVLNTLYEGVYLVDTKRHITFWNRKAKEITGYSVKDVIGKKCSDGLLIHITEDGKNQCGVSCPLRAAIEGEKQTERSVFLRHKDGHRIPVSLKTMPLIDGSGKIRGAVEIFRDDSTENYLNEKLTELEKQTEKALYDPLTNLPNRKFLEGNLAARFDEMKRYEWKFGLLFIDIDHFKDINDTYGHTVGDRVLQMVSSTLQKNARPSDIIGRWGGEEFVAIIVNVDEKHLGKVAERFRILVAGSGFPFEKAAVRVTISIGGTIAKPADSIESLIKRADRLMYKSKKSGRDRIAIS